MKKPTYNHVNALTHAITLLGTALRRASNNEHTNDLKKDINRLKEIRTMIQFTITHPTLPFPEPETHDLSNNRLGVNHYGSTNAG